MGFIFYDLLNYAFTIGRFFHLLILLFLCKIFFISQSM